MLTLSAAQNLIDAAKERAMAIDVAMCITVVDGGGHVIMKVRMDGAGVISSQIADDKAYTAAGIGMPTGELGRLVGPDGPLYGLPSADHGRIITFGGGFPLHADGMLIGGIGVSGGSVEQDVEVAQAALSQWNSGR